MHDERHVLDATGKPIIGKRERFLRFIERRWKLVMALSAAAATITGLLINLGQITAALDNLMRKPSPIRISVNYVRLFGAWQAPFIIEEMYGTGLLGRIETSRKETWLHFPHEGMPGLVGAVSAEFFATWQFKDARGIKTRVWEELMSDEYGYMPDHLLRIACGKDEICKQYSAFSEAPSEYIYVPYSMTPVRFAASGKYPLREVFRGVREKSNQVGFLLAILENATEDQLNNVEIEYQEYIRASLNEPLSDSALVDREILERPQRSMKYPLLRAGESFFLPIAVYVADQHGFPSQYIASKMVLRKVKYEIAGSKSADVIRGPNRESAARIEIPFGWYNQ